MTARPILILACLAIAIAPQPAHSAGAGPAAARSVAAQPVAAGSAAAESARAVVTDSLAAQSFRLDPHSHQGLVAANAESRPPSDSLNLRAQSVLRASLPELDSACRSQPSWLGAEPGGPSP